MKPLHRRGVPPLYRLLVTGSTMLIGCSSDDKANTGLAQTPDGIDAAAGNQQHAAPRSNPTGPVSSTTPETDPTDDPGTEPVADPSGPAHGETSAGIGDASAGSPNGTNATGAPGHVNPGTSPNGTGSSVSANDGGPSSPAGPDAGTAVPVPNSGDTSGACRLVVPATFRDFSGMAPDFNTDPQACGQQTQTAGNPQAGIVGEHLGPDGKPVLANPPEESCVTSKETFATWYSETSTSVQLDGELALFWDGAGYVNRYGSDGQAWLVSDPDQETYAGGVYPADCEAVCEAKLELQNDCQSVCAREIDDVEALQQLIDEADGGAPNRLQLQLDVNRMVLDQCLDQCNADMSDTIAACVASCVPCSYSPTTSCFGTLIAYDGTPLFFPVDSVTGTTRDEAEAKISELYGYPGWPYEREVTGNATLHNFSFTSELHLGFTYSDSMAGVIEVQGDDDVWIFVNGYLAVDLGGLHQPLAASVSITSANAAQFGLSPGNSYDIALFHAERQAPGSSLRFRVSGFDFTNLVPVGDCAP
jgi:fibro-slime domain-containing protein